MAMGRFFVRIETLRSLRKVGRPADITRTQGDACHPAHALRDRQYHLG